MSFVPSLASTQQLVVTLRSSKTDSFRLGHRLDYQPLFGKMSPHKTGLRETAEIEPSWVSPLLLLARVPRFVRLLLCSIIFSFSHPRQAPVFSFQSGRLLTRSAVISLLRDIVRLVGLPFHSLKGHPFRVGAASTAAAVGLPDWLIKIMDRWSSDCYQLYIRTCTPREVLPSAAQRMANK